jgi:hypothetical protein
VARLIEMLLVHQGKTLSQKRRQATRQRIGAARHAEIDKRRAELEAVLASLPTRSAPTATARNRTGRGSGVRDSKSPSSLPGERLRKMARRLAA